MVELKYKDSSAVVDTKRGVPIAVAPFANTMKVAELEWLGNGISEALTTDLAKKSGLQVLERSQTEARMKELGLVQTGLINADDNEELSAKSIGAKYLILGDYIPGSDRISMRVNIRMVDVISGEVVLASTVQGSVDDLTSLQLELTDLCMGKIFPKKNADSASIIKKTEKKEKPKAKEKTVKKESSKSRIAAGIRGGLNLPRFAETFNNPFQGKYEKAGLQLGTALQLRLNKLLVFQPEITYSVKGEKSVDQYYTTHEYKLNYLEIPALIQFYIPTTVISPLLYTGPSFAFKLGNIDIKEDYWNLNDDDRTEIDKYVRTFDFGLAMGAGIVFNTHKGHIIIDARYTTGITRIFRITGKNENRVSEDDLLKGKNHVLSLGLGYIYGIK
jgi:TolB-like protein